MKSESLIELRAGLELTGNFRPTPGCQLDLPIESPQDSAMRVAYLLVGAFLAVLGLSGCGVLRPSPDPELSYINIRGVKEIEKNERVLWETDYSAKPRIIHVQLGARELLDAQKLNSNLDIALKEFIGPEIRRRNLCDAGFDVRPGQRGGSKRGNYGFGLQCFWKDE